MNIYKLIINKIFFIFKKENILFNKNIIICKQSNIKFGHFTVYGLNKIIYKLKKKDFFLIKIKDTLEKHFCFDKVLIFNNFINIYINIKWLEFKIKKQLYTNILNYNNININIAIDYSSPNIAKNMHIGNIRSMIIGDSISRILEFLNYNVIRINHIGDWGINICIIIYKLINCKNLNKLKINDIENIYVKYKKKYINNKNFNKKINNILIKLQNKDIKILNIWNKIVNLSLLKNNKIYKIFNIRLNNNNILSESFCFNYIKDIINDLYNKNIISILDDGTKVVFLKNIKNKNNNNMAVILEKNNGTYLYSSTEISYIKYIFEKFKLNKLIYITDTRQKDHIKYSYLISKMANYIPSNSIKHYTFGIVLDENNNPIKTRNSNFIKIENIINIIFKIIKSNIIKKKSNININNISKILTINSIKYFELSKNRNDNYKFNIDSIISKTNNSFIYIQYTFCRIFSLLKKYNNLNNKINIKMIKINLKEKIEIELCIKIITFENQILNSSKGYPNIICNYLYDISIIYSRFYENLNILNANYDIKNTRIYISYLVYKIFKISSNLLGVKFINKI